MYKKTRINRAFIEAQKVKRKALAESSGNSENSILQLRERQTRVEEILAIRAS